MDKFNVKEEKEKIIKFIRDYYKKYNLGGVVIGISGGKDSAVVSAIFTEALGRENVLGVTMPCYSNELDMIDANKISKYYGFRMISINLNNVKDVFSEEIDKLGKFSNTELENSEINIKPRLRMLTLYYIAALYTNIKNKTYLVEGTSNKCEKYVGYFTKGGDNVSDINILEDFCVDEVIKLGEELKVPKEVLYKTPSDGLSGKTDEEKLGVKYTDITRYINNLEISEESKTKIKKLHDNSFHKYYIPTYKKI